MKNSSYYYQKNYQKNYSLMSQIYNFIAPYIKWFWDWSFANYPMSLLAVIPVLYLIYRILLYFWLFITALNPFRGMITKVHSVVDGDTIIVGNPRRKNRRLKVRLIGINAPESLRSLFQGVEPFGKEASNYVKRRLPKGRRVFLYYDAESRDKFGRVLAYVYLANGEFFNATLAKKGYAFAKRYPPNTKHSAYFESLARKARNRRRGLWQIYRAEGELQESYRRSREYSEFRNENRDR